MQVPENGFLSDYTILTIDQHKTSGPQTCQQCCKGKEAVTYCLTCSHICEECLEAHKQFKIYQNHEIRKENADQLVICDEVKSKKTYNCRLHPQDMLTLYCRTCQSLACLHCFVASHNGHDMGYIDNEKRKEVEALVTDFVEKVSLKLKDFEQNLQYITRVESNKTDGSAPLKDEINNRVDSMIAQLEARRTKLLKEVDDRFTKDLKELWAQKEYHESSILRMRNTVTFAERSLKCNEDTEMLALCTQVLTQLKELSQLEWDGQITENIQATYTTFEPDTATAEYSGRNYKH